MSSSDRAMLNAFKEISTMADRINLPRNIIVSEERGQLHCFPLQVSLLAGADWSADSEIKNHI